MTLRKIIFSFGAALLALSAPLAAVDSATPKDAPQYLNDLQTRLDHLARRANQPTAGASNVIGVRGSPQEPLSKQLYWKGKKSSAVQPEEVKLFRSAVSQARAGQNAEALVALKGFETKFPKSGLLPDVKETIRVLETPAAAPVQ